MTAKATLQTLTRPLGQWRTLYDDVDIVGEVHRLEACLDYLRGLRGALAAGKDFGVSLERDPTNPHDANAIRVIGWWTERRLFGEDRKRLHIGFIRKSMAETIARKHPAPMALAAELVTIEIEDEDDDDSYVEAGPVNIVINILVPA